MLSVPELTPEAERFWARVDQNGPVVREELGCCWVWTGAVMPADGRGRLRWNGENTYAPRVAYELTYGPLPKGKWALHHCDYPPCCRPDHIYAGSRQENVRDRQVRGRTARGSAHGSHTHPERFPRGEHHPRARLTTELVREIHTQRGNGATIIEIARALGHNWSTVENVIRGRAWTYLAPHDSSGGPPVGRARGERSGGAKLTTSDVLRIRERYAQEPILTLLAREFGVSPRNIAWIVQGRTWRHLLPQTGRGVGE